MNALTAADSVLIPLQCEYYALEGLTQLLATLDLVRDHLNPDLELKGVLLTMYDSRTNLSADVAAEVRRHLGPSVFETVIPRSVRLSEAPSHGQPIALYRPDSTGAIAYRALADEFRRRSDKDGRALGDLHVPAADRGPNPLTQSEGWWRRDRPTGAPGEPRSWPRVAHPAAERRTARADGDPDRADPTEPLPAAQADRRGGPGHAHREHRRARRPPADPRDRDDRRLPARRRRAAPPGRQAAGLDRIPAVVRQLADRDQLELALVENLQREDLDPIEAASAYRQLIDEFGFTQEQLATRVGRARSTVANTLRLLDLAPNVQAAVADGSLTEGHARALGGLPTEVQERVLDSVIGPGPVGSPDRGAGPPPARATARARSFARSGPTDPDLERVEEDLRRSLGTKVSLARSRRGGRIVIEYYSDEELGRLYERLTGGTA